MKSKLPAGYRLGIVNPTTLVGNELKLLLNERGIPYARIELIDTLGLEDLTLTDLNDEPALVQPARSDSFEDLDIVFFCGPAEKNREWIERREEDRFVAIDLSEPSAFGGVGVPLVGGLDVQQMPQDARLLLSPDPIAVALALLLAPLARRWPIRLCAASAIQPASEFGQAGIDELYQQTIRTLNLQAIPKEIFDRQLAFNLYPAAGAEARERYAGVQLRAILGAKFPLALSLTQGTLFHGFSFSVYVECAGHPGKEQLAEALGESAGIALAASDDEPFSTVDAAGRDEILVGRISLDPDMHGGFWIWAVVDNLRRVSALNAVLIAEEVISRFEPAN